MGFFGVGFEGDRKGPHPTQPFPRPYNDWGERQLNEPEQARQPETETAQRSPVALV
jgi:hypothetical protein